MNRLVIIGNGFDLAHNLKTSYMDFINWYWEKRLKALLTEYSAVSEDCLCRLEIKNTKEYASWSSFFFSYSLRDSLKREWKYPPSEIISEFKDNTNEFSVTHSRFFETIIQSIETKGWVDIENDYYRLLTEYALREEDSKKKVDKLNEQLKFIQDKLIAYLSEIKIPDSLLNTVIRQKIYAPYKQTDISIEGQKSLKDHIKDELNLNKDDLDCKLQQYGSSYSSRYVEGFRGRYSEQADLDWDYVPKDLLFPNQIMLLNFNYTPTAQNYCKDYPIFSVNHIHGTLKEPRSVIFGYGDELDENYNIISNRNDNSLLTNVKSIRYLESDNYRKMLSFIESEPYQVVIMGHSCGNSDRTLLNTLFEHKNCVSIKPYYYVKEDGSDNYIELVQNISRNFTDMKLMRDRVVNKTYTEPLTEV